MASASDMDFKHLKREQVTTSDGSFTRDTDVLDGMAEDSAVMDATNETVQYKTPPLPKNDLGGENDPNG